MNLETFKKAEKIRQRIEGLNMMKSYLQELFKHTNNMSIKVSFEFYSHGGSTPLDYKINNNYSPFADPKDFKIIGDAIDKKIEEFEFEFKRLKSI